MIAGSVNRNGELIIPIRALDANGYMHRFEAVVDTGFNGEITMTPLRIRELGFIPADPVVITMANNESKTFNSYHGTVIWDGQMAPVEVVESDGQTLIGTGLLWGSLLTAAITDNGEVTVNPLPGAPPVE